MTPLVACPRCGENNEADRLYCWVCYQPFEEKVVREAGAVAPHGRSSVAMGAPPPRSLWFYVLAVPAGFLGVVVLVITGFAFISFYFAKAGVGPVAILLVLGALGAFFLSSKGESKGARILRSFEMVLLGVVGICGVVGILLCFTCFIAFSRIYPG